MNLAEEFICPVCFLTPRNFIFTCKYGHAVCGACKCKLVKQSCPVCRATTLIRNQFAERLASKCFDTSLIYCRYSVFGCKETAFGLEHILTHELSCKFKGNLHRDELICLCVLCTGISTKDTTGEPTNSCKYSFLWLQMMRFCENSLCREGVSCKYKFISTCVCYKCSGGVYWEHYMPCLHRSPILMNITL